jgi:hypothetical protein
MRFVVGDIRFVLGTALAVVACAGKSTSQGDDNDDGGGGHAASAATGGTGTGGTNSAGTGSAGTNTGGTGAAPEPNPDCLLPPESGTCEAYFVRYAFDASTGVCDPFVYGGCGGNANNFDTPAECYAACVTSGRNDLAACVTSDSCQVQTPGCCGACEPAVIEQFVGINSMWGDAYYTATCPGGTTCGACPEPTGPATMPYFTATCDQGHCAVVDTRLTRATECVEAADCHLRHGTSCCENCMPADPSNLVAISSEQALRDIACAPDTACDQCIPEYPPGAAADCINGRCVVDLNLR